MRSLHSFRNILLASLFGLSLVLAPQMRADAFDDYLSAYNQAVQQKDTAAELNALNRMAEIQPANGPVFLNRGVLLKKMGKHSEALSDYTRAIELLPGDKDGYYNRGILYVAMKRYPEALADYQKALQIDPDFAKAHNGMGSYYERVKAPEKAMASYSKAIALDASLSDAYWNRAILNETNKSYDNALSDYTRYINLMPNDPDGYLKRAAAKAVYIHDKEGAYSDLYKARDLYKQQGKETQYKECVKMEGLFNDLFTALNM
jgi:tetratricopeptide (TPR) repeat protein